MIKQMLLKFKLIIACLIAVPTVLIAQTHEYKDYTITNGDTLWDISNKELSDPFLWPKVWKENPDIKNPDLIFPTQKIKIPLYLIQKEPPQEIVPEIKPIVRPRVQPVAKPVPRVQKPAGRIIEPLKREYLANRHLLIASGFITDHVQGLGVITDSQSGQNLLAKGDYAYIQATGSVKRGDKFYIMRSIEKVIHPKTDTVIGYLVEILGTAEVVDETSNNPKILITNSYTEISPGDLLDNYYDIDSPLAPEYPRKPQIDGSVIASKHLHIINGKWDVVYIDKGRNDGLQIGDMLATTLQSQHRIMNGLIQVINTRETTATAIIRKSNSEIAKGDGVTGAM